jgi:hypothetical protein
MRAELVKQVTVAILKPDLVAQPSKVDVRTKRMISTLPQFEPLFLCRILTQAVMKIIHHNGFTVLRDRSLIWSHQEAESFYAEHKGWFRF